jgi:hypothetical protein
MRVVRWFGAARAPWVIIAVALALAAPALTAGFAADDHLHRVVARDDTGIDGLPSRPLDLFVFASGDPDEVARLRDVGVYPWYTDPALKLAFFRPVSSATHAVDHALWPDSPAVQLAHSLAWMGLALAAAWAFFRRFAPAPWLAGLALALYAVDDARGPVVGWIANRNALIALALAIPALVAHDRWRRDGWAPGRWLGPLAFALALGAGESSLAIMAYVGAHALWLDRAPWKDRALALAPYLVVIVAWRALYVHLGYGTAGSGIYLDPGADPAAYAGAAATRLPLLLLGQLALPWSDLASLWPVLGPGVALAMLLLALGVIAAVGLACARLLRREPSARFFATGMLLAAVPVASTFPADRLLGFIGLGAMGLVAQLVGAALTDRGQLGDGRARRGAATAVAGLMILVHAVLAPPLLAVRARTMTTIDRVFERADAGIPRGPEVTTQTVILTGAPSDALAGFLPLLRQSEGTPRPAHLYLLATLTTEVTLTRVDDRTLRVAATDGLLRHEVDRMTRSPAHRPFRVGDTVPLTGLTMELERVTADGRPASVLARFDRPLDDPSLVWLRWQDKTFVPYTPPAIGATDTLPAVDLMSLLE